jgi:hypothetical protein
MDVGDGDEPYGNLIVWWAGLFTWVMGLFERAYRIIFFSRGTNSKEILQLFKKRERKLPNLSPPPPIPNPGILVFLRPSPGIAGVDPLFPRTQIAAAVLPAKVPPASRPRLSR